MQWDEFIVPEAQFLAPGLFAGGGFENLVKDSLTRLLNRGVTVYYTAAIDVHIAAQSLIHFRI